MPIVKDPPRDQSMVAGIDGCRRGWLIVELNLQNQELSVTIEETIAPFLKRARQTFSAIMIDMPIGLPDQGRRACEQMARADLGARRSSVFSVPRRPMLSFDTYEEANRWGKTCDPSGLGLSKQSWHLIPKIRELDDALTATDQAFVKETHPELAFARLRGAPCEHSKKSPEGAKERSALLRREGLNTSDCLAALRDKFPRKADWLDDDLLDALVLSLSARAFLVGNAKVLTDGAYDSKGLVMEIWG